MSYEAENLSTKDARGLQISGLPLFGFPLCYGLGDMAAFAGLLRWNFKVCVQGHSPKD